MGKKFESLVECHYSNKLNKEGRMQPMTRAKAKAIEPKKLKREKVKEVLLSFRRSLQKVGSECTNCSLTAFDYV